MSEHTPTPWSLYEHDPLVIVDDKGSSLGEMVPGDPYISPATALANAAFVIRAVNSHETLLQTLHAIIQLDHHNMGPESRATKIARAALAAVGLLTPPLRPEPNGRTFNSGS